MYCRDCHYDLRGQTTYRCPECGREFDPTNSKSFHDQVPGIGTKFRELADDPASPLGKGIAFFVLTSIWIGICFIIVLSNTGHRICWFPYAHCQRNLELAMSAWKEDHSICPDSSSMNSLSNFPVSYSPYSERSAMWNNQALRRSGGNLVALGLVTFAYAALTRSVFSPQRKRTRSLFFAFAAASFIVFVVGLFSPAIANYKWPPSHQYLDDFVFLCDSDWSVSPPAQTKTIVAYDIQNWRRYQVIVAFMHGEVAEIDICKFDELMTKQGRTVEKSPGFEEILKSCR